MKDILNVEMSTKEIAEITGKKHFHVLDTTRKLLKKLDNQELDSLKSEYLRLGYKVIKETDAQGIGRPVYILEADLVNMLMSGYKENHRLLLISRIRELEEELRRKEEELSVMKNIVWEVINGQNYIGQEQALKMAGIKHPRLFMKYLKEDKNFYNTVIYKRKFLKSIQCNAEGDKYLKFTKAGFKWLLDSKDKANEWVQGIKKAKAAKPA